MHAQPQKAVDLQPESLLVPISWWPGFLSWESLNTECLQAEALTEMGKLLHKQRDYRRARAQLQKAVDLRPDSLQVQALSSLRHLRVCCQAILMHP